MEGIQGVQGFITLVGRLFIAVPLISFGIYKFNNFDMLVQWMSFKNLPIPEVLLALAIAFELGGALLLILGFKIRAVAFLLIFYLVPVMLAMHDFWAIENPTERQATLESFAKGFMIMGGLLFLLVLGAGTISLDNLLSKNKNDITTE